MSIHEPSLLVALNAFAKLVYTPRALSEWILFYSLSSEYLLNFDQSFFGSHSVASCRGV